MTELQIIDNSPLNKKEEDICLFFVNFPDEGFLKAMKRAGYKEATLVHWKTKFNDPRIQNRIEQLKNEHKLLEQNISLGELRKEIIVEVHKSIKKLAELRDNARSEYVQKDCALEILNRAGLSSVKYTVKSEKKETVAALEKEVENRVQYIREAGVTGD